MMALAVKTCESPVFLILNEPPGCVALQKTTYYLVL